MRIRSLIIPCLRLFLGAIFFTSGMGKLTHGDFFGLIGPVWLADKLAPYGLGLWATFVGWCQVFIGLLLLSQRFATLGAVMLVPMLTNIFVITVSLQWRGTPYVNAMLLAMNAALLVADWPKLRPIVADEGTVWPRTRSTPDPLVTRIAIAGIAVGLLAPAVHSLHRVATFTLAGASMVLLAIAGWRYYAASRRVALEVVRPRIVAT